MLSSLLIVFAATVATKNRAVSCCVLCTEQQTVPALQELYPGEVCWSLAGVEGICQGKHGAESDVLNKW